MQMPSQSRVPLPHVVLQLSPNPAGSAPQNPQLFSWHGTAASCSCVPPSTAAPPEDAVLVPAAVLVPPAVLVPAGLLVPGVVLVPAVALVPAVVLVPPPPLLARPLVLLPVPPELRRDEPPDADAAVDVSGVPLEEPEDSPLCMSGTQ